MKFKLTHARHDPAICLACGLFESIKKGDRKKFKLDVVYEYGKGKSLRFCGPEPLDDLDLRVLQGLVAMAGPSGVVLDLKKPKSEQGEHLALMLEPKWEAMESNALVVKNSFYALAKEIGYKNPGSTRTLKDIRESIERLWTVSIIAREGTKRRGFRMLADYSSDSASSRLYVALNPMIAEVVLGERPYTRISMYEVRALKTSPARIIHQRLCGYISPSKSHPTPIDIDTLCKYAWPRELIGTQKQQAAAMRQRRVTMRKAVAELASIGWGIDECGKDKFRIGRPVVL